MRRAGQFQDTRDTLTLEELTTLAQLECLRSEWQTLWQRCPDVTPFQSPGWLIPWWKHLGHGALWVLSLRVSDDRLCALAPFFIAESSTDFRRGLFLLGTGVTDYLDILVEPALRTEALTVLAKYLEFHQARWDFCHFQQLFSGAALLEMPIRQSWQSRVSHQEVCPLLQLPCHPEGLNQFVPKSTLTRLAYYRRRFQKLPGAACHSAHEENFIVMFDAFLALHQARWASRGKPGAIAEPHLKSFHREAAFGLFYSGELRLYVLHLADQIAGAIYIFIHRKRAFFYLSGFAPELHSFSPGLLLIGHAIEESIREGCQSFDFLRGNEPYKYQWGAHDQQTFRKLVLRSNAIDVRIYW